MGLISLGSIVNSKRSWKDVSRFINFLTTNSNSGSDSECRLLIRIQSWNSENVTSSDSRTRGFQAGNNAWICYGTMCARQSQENVKHARGAFVYCMLWLIKPRNLTTISTMQISFDKHSKRQYYWTEIKNNIKHTFSRGHRFWVGLLASVHSTAHVHPC
jgi:hypothetical protein